MTALGIEATLLTAAEVIDRWPLIGTENLFGGLWLPKDGQTNPTDTAMSLAKGAKMNGARFFENTQVTDINVSSGEVRGAATEHSEITAKYVINCAGMWAREVGSWTNTPVPLHAVEHYYIVTEPIADLPPDTPVLRDIDNALYIKEDAGKLLIGATEIEAKPWGMAGIPDDFCFDEIAPDQDHFMRYVEAAVERIPVLARTSIRTIFCGPESFTPNQKMQLGPAPGVRNLFIAAGLNTVGIQAAAGVGKTLSEWIVKGTPALDLSDADVRRNLPFRAGATFLHDRTIETVGVFNDIHWPYKQLQTARNARRSPLHGALETAHAFFGENNGWERPLWFAPDRESLRIEYSFGRQNWFEYSAAEHRAVRERVGLMDYCAFSKLELRGPDAESVLNWVSTGSVSVPIGKTLYTLWLNQHGGIETDLTIVRTAEQAFLIIGTGATQSRDFHWLNDHIPADAQATLSDLTSATAGVALMGPRSREVLASFTSSDLSSEVFPFGTSQVIDLGYARARAVRLSFAGELGFELYMSSEFAAGIFDSMLARAAELDIKLVGLHAVDSLRIEKGFRHWGHDISPEDTPLHAGMGFTVDYEKPGGCIGLDSLLRDKEARLTRRLVQFVLAHDAPFAYHDEPIWCDGRRVGHVTSGAYGHTLGGWTCLGYVKFTHRLDPENVSMNSFEIEIAGERYPARASLRPLYDPASTRMRA